LTLEKKKRSIKWITLMELKDLNLLKAAGSNG